MNLLFKTKGDCFMRKIVSAVLTAVLCGVVLFAIPQPVSYANEPVPMPTPTSTPVSTSGYDELDEPVQPMDDDPGHNGDIF
jgi:hypothetical protein